MVDLFESLSEPASFFFFFLFFPAPFLLRSSTLLASFSLPFHAVPYEIGGVACALLFSALPVVNH